MLGLATTSILSAQITIEEYERKVRVELGDEDSVEAPAATSECGPVKVTHTDMLASGGCAGTLIRTYVYEDDCKNSATAEVYFFRVDEVGPYFENLPPDMKVERNEIPPRPEITAKDKNGLPVNITFEEKAAGPVIIRMWTATDSCGNESFGMQTISLEDSK